MGIAASRAEKRGRTSDRRVRSKDQQSSGCLDDRDLRLLKKRGTISETFDKETLHEWLQWHSDPKVVVAAMVTAVILNKVAPEDMITIDAYKIEPEENEYWNVQIQYQVIPGGKTHWENSMDGRFYEQISAKQVLGGEVELTGYTDTKVDHMNVRGLYDAIDVIFDQAEWHQNIKLEVRPLPELTNWRDIDYLRHEVVVCRYGYQRVVESSEAYVDVPLTRRLMVNMGETAFEAVRAETHTDVGVSDRDPPRCRPLVFTR